MSRTRPMSVLASFLFFWEPLRIAGELTQSLPTLGWRGGPAIAELLAHAAIAAVSVAAAWSLWNEADHGPTLALTAIALSATASVQSLYWSSLPRQTQPGAHLPLAMLAVAHASAWIAYLQAKKWLAPLP